MSVDDDTLQTGDDVTPETDLEVGSESATDTGENPEQQTTDTAPEVNDGDPAGFTKRINQKHYELQEERRARLAIEAELEKLRQSQPVETRPEVPPMPDQYDDDFDVKMRQRDEALRAQLEYDAKQTVAQQQEEQRRQAQQVEAAQKQQERLQKFVQRAQEQNISQQEIAVAAQSVAAYGVSPELEDLIVDSEDGALLAIHLAKNPAEMDVMRGMNGYQIGMHVAMNVLPVIKNAQPVQASAPPPADTLGGGGAPPRERGPKGATYE